MKRKLIYFFILSNFLCTKIFTKMVYAYGWIDDGTDKTGPFVPLLDNINESSGSLYSLVRKIFFVAILCGLISLGARISLDRRGNQRSDNKTRLIYFFVGAIAGIAVVSILNFASNIGKNL